MPGGQRTILGRAIASIGRSEICWGRAAFPRVDFIYLILLPRAETMSQRPSIKKTGQSDSETPKGSIS